MSARQFIQTAKAAAADWSDDHATRLSAALAYYTMLSLAPLLVIAIKIVGMWYQNSGDAQHKVTGYLQQFMGAQSAEALNAGHVSVSCAIASICFTDSIASAVTPGNFDQLSSFDMRTRLARQARPH